MGEIINIVNIKPDFLGIGPLLFVTAWVSPYAWLIVAPHIEDNCRRVSQCAFISCRCRPLRDELATAGHACFAEHLLKIGLNCVDVKKQMEINLIVR